MTVFLAAASPPTASLLDLSLSFVAERDRALDSVRSEVAELVVAATEKVVGESLDADRHHRLIEKAIAEVGSADGRGRS